MASPAANPNGAGFDRASFASKILWQANQANSFKEWANFYLKQRDMEVENMTTSWSLNIPRYVRHPRFKSQKVDNIKVCIDFLEAHFQTRCIGISPSDVVDGNPKQVLGLVFLLISHVAKHEAKSKQVQEELRSPSTPNILASPRIPATTSPTLPSITENTSPRPATLKPSASTASLFPLYSPRAEATPTSEQPSPSKESMSSPEDSEYSDSDEEGSERLPKDEPVHVHVNIPEGTAVPATVIVTAPVVESVDTSGVLAQTGQSKKSEEGSKAEEVSTPVYTAATTSTAASDDTSAAAPEAPPSEVRESMPELEIDATIANGQAEEVVVQVESPRHTHKPTTPLPPAKPKIVVHTQGKEKPLPPPKPVSMQAPPVHESESPKTSPKTPSKGRLAALQSGEKRDRVMSMTLDSDAESAAGELIDPTLTPVQAHKEIMTAVRSNNLALFRSLLKAPNVDPTLRNSECLRVAAELGHSALVSLLLADKRADPAASNNVAIVLASWNGHVDVVKTLLQDPRVDPASKLNYAIRGAVDANHVDVVRTLLHDNRVDPTGLNNFCIRTAAEKGYIEIVRLLLDDGRCDPTAEDNYAVTEAVKNGHTDIVELLNEYLARADPDEPMDEAAAADDADKKSRKRHTKHRHHKSNISNNSGLRDATKIVSPRERRNTLHVPSPTAETTPEDSEEDVAQHTPTQKVRNRKALMQQTKQVQQLRPKSVEHAGISRFEAHAYAFIAVQSRWRSLLTRKNFERKKEENLKDIRKSVKKSRKAAAAVVRMQAILRGRDIRNFPTPELRTLRRRYNIANEIFSTEESYVKGLQCLIKVYLANLKAVPPDVLPPTTLKAIFSNSEVIFGFNSVMLNQIRTRMSRWYTEGMRIGDIFVKFADFMKVYTAYVNNYNDAFKVFMDYTPLPAVYEALQKSREHPDVKGSELMNFLILPVQRLPRYVLLLRDLLKYTPPEHADYENLSKAVDKMSSVADYVNEKKREAENLNAVMQITTHIVGYDKSKNGELAIATRHYVRQGPLDVVPSPNVNKAELLAALPSKQFKQMYIFLFNDLVILSTLEKRKDETNQPTSMISQFKTAGLKAIGGGVTSFFSGSSGDKEKTLEKQAKDSRREELDPSLLQRTFALEELAKLPDLAFRFNQSINLSGLEVVDLDSSASSHRFALKESQQIGDHGVTAVFSAPSEEVKEQWIADIDEAIWSQIKATRTRSDYDAEKEEQLNPQEKEGILIEGYLHKQGADLTWKKRYFTLVGTHLRQYSRREDVQHGEEPTQWISILNCNLGLWPVADRPWCFSVVHPKGSLYFATSKGSSRLEWLNSMRLAIRVHLRDVKRRQLIAQEDFVNKVVTEGSSEASLGASEATDEKAKVAKIDLMATNAAKEKKERRVKDGDEPGSDGADSPMTARRKKKMERSSTTMKSPRPKSSHTSASKGSSGSSKYGTMRPERPQGKSDRNSAMYNTLERSITKTLPLKSGVLYKESNSKPGKFRRYLVALTKGHLTLMTPEGHKFSFNTPTARVIDEEPRKEEGGKDELWAVTLSTQSHSTRLAATSLAEIQAWVEAINEVITAAAVTGQQ